MNSYWRKTLVALLVLAAMMLPMMVHADENECTHANTVCVDMNDGTHGWKCKDCGSIVADMYPHFRTCTSKAGKCEICGAPYDGEPRHELDKMEYHDLGDGTHVMACQACSTVSDPEEHYYHCTSEEAKCELCGVAVTTQPIHTLDKSKEVDMKDGGKGYACMDCDYIEPIQDESNHTHTPEVLPGKAATCTEAGLMDGKICSECKKILEEQRTIDALGHDWDKGTVTKEPTTTEKGERTYTCGRCSTTRTEDIDCLVPEVDPGYSFANVSFDGSAVTGQLLHTAGTPDADRVYVRVTLFMSNGAYMIGVVEADRVGDDLTFELGASGDFAYITLVATGTKKSVQPGTGWKMFGTHMLTF